MAGFITEGLLLFMDEVYPFQKILVIVLLSVSSLTVSGVEKSPYKVDTLRIAKWKNKMKLHKQFSEESLKSLNGECVSVPADQYKQLLRAQQVSR